MKLSRLKELRPDVWEEAKRQTIKLRSQERWDLAIIDDDLLTPLFKWRESDQGEQVWNRIDDGDFTLYDERLASQTKQPDPESKKVIEYWRYQFAGMAMQGFDLEQYANSFGNKL